MLRNGQGAFHLQYDDFSVTRVNPLAQSTHDARIEEFQGILWAETKLKQILPVIHQKEQPHGVIIVWYERPMMLAICQKFD